MSRSPEFTFVVLCLHRPLATEQLAKLRERTAEPLRWERVLAIAQRHRVVGVVLSRCQVLGIAFPPAVRVSFDQAARISAAFALELTWESGRLQSGFRAAATEAIFLKGPSLSMLAYGEVGSRHTKDIDVLVSREALASARQVLRQAGYEERLQSDTFSEKQNERWLGECKAAEWFHPERQVEVELHWRLTDLPFPQAADWTSRAQKRAADVRISDNLHLCTLAGDDLLLYLCVHGASHAWSRLKWLADVHVLFTRKSGEQLESFYHASSTQGMDRPVGQALILCERFFQLSLPASLRQQLMGEPCLRLLTGMAAFTILRGGAAREIYELPFGTSVVYLSRLLLA